MSYRSSVKRWNPLLGEWIIIAPATGVRPWSGAVVSSSPNELPVHDPDCYLCPGVIRASGEVNPNYDGIYVFDNDYPSLSMNTAQDESSEQKTPEHPARGICRVVCFTPKHNVTFAEMTTDEVHAVFMSFYDQFEELSAIEEIQHVMIFENRGKIIGVSNPHPHGQIYCTDFVPRIPATRYAHALLHKREKDTCIFCKIIEDELADGRRIITENDDFVAFTPYFARLSYEVFIFPRRHVPFITELSVKEIQSLAAIHKEMMVRFDNLFQMPFPNITVFQNAPCSSKINPESYHFHIEFLPPLRSPDKLKYMAGFESGGGNIVNPIFPEESAEALRNVSTIHYLKRNQ
ncbi:MAG: galactose-1-phosphate uridylyltransferase [Candidatus Latescibacteria bacterium]|nr:galactose-1-phosphate uridylyltransferase [Candidatus Latescibacterota bacterium]